MRTYLSFKHKVAVRAACDEHLGFELTSQFTIGINLVGDSCDSENGPFAVVEK